MLRERQTPLSVRQSAEEAASDLHALMAQAEKAVTSVLHGEHAQRKAGAGEKFWQFREYTPTDRPQDIDWKQSAKTDEIYIRQKEWQTPQTSIFWCNQSASMDFSTKAHDAKVLILALSILMTRAGEQVGFFGVPRTGRSEAALQRIGNALVETQNHLPLPDFKTFACPKNTKLVQAGDFLSPLEEIQTAFKNLSAQSDSGLVIQILDPQEIELPFSGRVLFEDPANKTRQLVNHVTSIRDAYQQRIRDHIKAVETLCRECRWTYILHRTDTPIKDTLAAIWAETSHHALATPGIRA